MLSSTTFAKAVRASSDKVNHISDEDIVEIARTVAEAVIMTLLPEISEVALYGTPEAVKAMSGPVRHLLTIAELQ